MYCMIIKELKIILAFSKNKFLLSQGEAESMPECPRSRCLIQYGSEISSAVLPERDVQFGLRALSNTQSDFK